jgi:hypothetical protein
LKSGSAIPNEKSTPADVAAAKPETRSLEVRAPALTFGAIGLNTVDHDACRAVDRPADHAGKSREATMAVAFDRNARGHQGTREAGAAVRAHVSMAIAALFVLGLVGCAAGLNGGVGDSAPQDSVIVGVFTGEYVDGKPLFRLPAIQVVGSRIDLGRD